MPSKYDENTKAKAVRLVREHADDYDSEWAAMSAISAGWDERGDATQVGAARPRSTPGMRRGCERDCPRVARAAPQES